MHTKFGWLVIGALVVGTGAVWCRQRSVIAALRDELGREQTAARPLAAARAEHERLLATQPAAGEVERLAAEGEALARARTEVAALRAQVEQAERAGAEKRDAPPERFAVGSTVPTATWTNAGVGTPQATLETALWAAAGGDVDAFAKTVTFINRQAKRAAQALLDSLPEATRLQYGSPERLIAFLTVRDVPIGSAQVREFDPVDHWPAPAAQMKLMLRDTDGKAKYVNLIFMKPDDSWKLVVTDGVVAKYAAQLKAPAQATGGK